MIEQIANLYIYGMLFSDVLRYYSRQCSIMYSVSCVIVIHVSFGFKLALSNWYFFLECFKNIRFFVLFLTQTQAFNGAMSL